MGRNRKKIALVTGASSGIGRCLARRTAENYPELHEIWVLARRKEELEALQTECPETRFRILVMDLADKETFTELAGLLGAERPHICLLVNGAGLGHNGPTARLETSGLCDMIDVNCRALIAVTRLCLPYMGRGSRILQLASGSAFLPQPGFAVYAASKSCVLSFSRALREELRPRGIVVTAVCPGPVDTDFFRAGGITLSPLKRFFLADPEKVAKKALADARKGKALSVYGLSMKMVRIVAKVLPEGWLVRFHVNQQGSSEKIVENVHC